MITLHSLSISEDLCHCVFTNFSKSYRITLHKYRSVPIGLTLLTEFFKDLFAQWSDNFFGFTAPIALSAIALARAVKLLATL